MPSEMRSGVIGVLFMVTALLLGVALAVYAQEETVEMSATALGPICFRMLPFDDTIELNTAQFNLPPGVPSFFTYGSIWRGLTLYTLKGSGTSSFNPDVQVFTLDMKVWNQSGFFAAQPLCDVTGATDGALIGRWKMICGGEPPVPPNPRKSNFLVEGTMVNIACPREIGIPEMSVQGFALPSAGMLAGEAK
jgi:hypothetical protein